MTKVFAADFNVLKSESKIVLFFPILYTIIGSSSSFLRVFSVIITINLIINVMGYNDRSGFERYMLILPVSRATIVISRYVCAVGLSAFMLLVQFILSRLGFLNAEPMSLAELVGVISTVTIYISVLFPILIKLGVEKGRTAYMTCLIGVMVIGTLLLGDEFNISLPAFVQTLMPIICVIGLAVSCSLSIKIYNEREF